jgi:hypothetical protein
LAGLTCVLRALARSEDLVARLAPQIGNHGWDLWVTQVPLAYQRQLPELERQD